MTHPQIEAALPRALSGTERGRLPLPRIGRALAAVALLTLLPVVAAAQEPKPDAESSPAAAAQRRSFLYYLFGGGGLVGVGCTLPILGVSMAAVAMIIEHLITVRRPILIPNGLPEELQGLITKATFPQAEQQCRLKPSYLSYVVLAGLQEVQQGYSAIEKAMEEASQVQAARIFRKLELLASVGNIATMLGLFGTVVGLVIAFKQVADTQGVAKASDLAGGIYLALMTTIEGLIVAIPTVTFYSWFKNRADALVHETTMMAEYAFSGYKRARLSRRSAEPPKPARGPGGN